MARDGPALIHPEVAAALERLEAIDPGVAAFVDEPNRRSRLESSPPAPGPLHGVAVGVKDLFRVDGILTRAGSRLPPSAFEGDESLVVGKLKQAGAVVLGKTAMDEFAYCEPPPTRNPLDPRRTPGGSSSGSAAAVAAGICPLAVGSQTLQSVLVPAAYCGVVGFKPTFERLPFDGIPLSPSIDTVGFLARTVGDVRTAAAAVIPGWDGAATHSRPVLGVPAPWGTPGHVEEAWRGLERRLEALRSREIELRPATLPWDVEESRLEWEGRVGDLLHAEMALVHRPWFDRFGYLYRPGTAKGVRRGLEISRERLRECHEARADLAGRLVGLASRTGIDAWICPSAPGVAPIGDQPSGFSWMTGLWSYAGFPAISIPVFDGPEGMPLGVQLIAMPGRDEDLLGWADTIADALAHDRPDAS